MQKVTQFQSRAQAEPLMPMTPQDRVRASIAVTIAPEMAERLLQHDKANPAFRLSDLLDDDERAVFVADILDLFSPERRAERTIRLNVLRGHTHALAEDEQQTIAKQARQDVIRYSDVPRFGVVRPGYCWVCKQQIVHDASTLLISASLKVDVHGMCCAKDDSRYELSADFSYRLIGSAR